MISIYQGDFKRIDIVFRHDDGVPLNISGCTIYFTAKSYYSQPDSEAIILFETGSHDIPESGQTHIDINSEMTNQCPGQYVSAFHIKDSAGRITTFDSEEFVILPSPRIFTS